MIKTISVFLSRGIGLRLNSSDNEKEIFAYSIEVLLSLLINILILSFTAIVLNKKTELLVFIVFFSGLRIFAGGYHAKTHLECFSVTLIIFLISALSNTYLIVYGKIILIIGILFSTIMVFYIAPAESENKPLNKNERKKYRIVSRISVIMLSFLAICLYYLKAETHHIYITAAVAMVIESASLKVKHL